MSTLRLKSIGCVVHENNLHAKCKFIINGKAPHLMIVFIRELSLSLEFKDLVNALNANEILINQQPIFTSEKIEACNLIAIFS